MTSNKADGPLTQQAKQLCAQMKRLRQAEEMRLAQIKAEQKAAEKRKRDFDTLLANLKKIEAMGKRIEASRRNYLFDQE